MVADTFGTGSIGSSSVYSPITYQDTLKKLYVLYTQAELATKGIVPGMTLYGLGWKKMTNTSLLPAISASLGINLRMGGQYISYDSAYFATNYPSMFFWTNLFSAGFFNVGFYQNGIDLVVPPTPSWMTLMFKDSAVYTGGSLEIYTRWDTPMALTALSGNTLWAVEPNAVPQVYNMNVLSSSLSSPQLPLFR